MIDMKLVYIISPYAGDIEHNTKMAKKKGGLNHVYLPR